MIGTIYGQNFSKKWNTLGPSGFHLGGVAGGGHDHRVVGWTDFSRGSEGD